MILNYRVAWLTLSWSWLFTIIILSLITIPKTIDVSIPYIDKVEHTVSYFLLMFLFSQCYLHYKTRFIYAIFFIGIGITLEFFQGFTATRQFEYSDMIANSIGVILGLILADSYLRNIVIFVDSKIKLY